MEIKVNLNEPIKKSGVKKKHIAKELGVNQNTLSAWISGRSPISLINAARISIMIGCDLNDLIEIEQ